MSMNLFFFILTLSPKAGANIERVFRFKRLK
jgi:hypothetical protein